MLNRNTIEANERTQVWLGLSEDEEQAPEPAPWIGPLLALGTRASRYVDKNPDRQLVVAVTVPSRDFAAALVGCGWVMASKAPILDSPLEILRSIEPGSAVRAVNNLQVITGRFISLNESLSQPRAQFAGSTWQVSEIKSAAAISSLEVSERMNRPIVGSVGRMAGLDREWEARLAAPAADLAIVGTIKWLQEDFSAFLSRESNDTSPQPIRDLLLPKIGPTATWFTRVYSAARFDEQLPLDPAIRAVVLDGNGAIKYLAEIETQVVVCILDRSVHDESASDLIVQTRNSRGKIVSISEELGWIPPAGIEVLAFTVAL